MKVTVDTNVLVSATFWYGDSYEVLVRAEQKEFELVLSESILEEFYKVLHYPEIQEKIKNKNLEMTTTIAKLAAVASMVETGTTLNIVMEDPDDNKVLECAKAGKADFIITKDHHLLRLHRFEHIPILTPNQFLKNLGRH